MTEMATSQSAASLPQEIPQASGQWRGPSRVHQGVEPLASGITVGGSFEKDRIVKSGRVMKRTRKTKSWKSTYIVLRPQLLNMYRDESESRLRNQIKLSEVTAVARQKDPKRKGKHVFGIFTPSRNYHFEAASDADAQEWVESIRQEARIYEAEEEILLASPGGARSAYQGFERAFETATKMISPRNLMPDETAGATSGTGYSSSDLENMASHLGASFPPKVRARNHSNISNRQGSYIEYSGTEGRGSYSDLSEAAGPSARLSALSLSPGESQPFTGSKLNAGANAVYGISAPTRPSLGARNASQLSTSGLAGTDGRPSMQKEKEQDPERVINQGWILLLKSKRGVRSWKKIWMVLRPKGLAMYKNEDEYRPVLILAFSSILEAVEIDSVSKSKEHCLQLITEERNYRFCTKNEESLTRWLGSFKSLLSKRRAAMKEGS